MHQIYIISGYQFLWISLLKKMEINIPENDLF